jgi:hypothetical protein
MYAAALIRTFRRESFYKIPGIVEVTPQGIHRFKITVWNSFVLSFGLIISYMNKGILIVFCDFTRMFCSRTFCLSNASRDFGNNLRTLSGRIVSAFGHSAIRVYDPQNQIDLAFNWGVFDFDQPNFYFNFARGFLYYKLGVYSYPHFSDHYISYNRYVHEQVDLNLLSKAKIIRLSGMECKA